MSQTPPGVENTGNGGPSEALAWLAGSRMPLIIAGEMDHSDRDRVVNGLLALGALLITDNPLGYHPGNILDMGRPDPGSPLPEQAWKHAEEAAKKADLVLLLEPLPPELATLADLAAWSGCRVLRLGTQGETVTAAETANSGDFQVLDTREALAWLLNVTGLKEQRA